MFKVFYFVGTVAFGARGKGNCLVLGNPRIDSDGKIAGSRQQGLWLRDICHCTEHSVLNSLFIKCKLVQSSRRWLGNRDQEP